jgi:phosphate transport system substrate-binding protein
LNKKLISVAALFSASALVLAGCAPGEQAEGLSGTIVIDGSSTVGPASEIAAELFMKANPGVRVQVNISGTGGGFEKFCNGDTDASNASREIKEEEAAICDAAGIKYDFVTVANDALSIVVNAKNPLECISVEDLSTFTNAEAANKIMKWGDVKGMPAAIADIDFVLYRPGEDSGTFDFFTEEINGDTGVIRRDDASRDIGEDDLAAVRGVEEGIGAMSIIPFSYYQEAASEGLIKALEIDGGDGCKAPTLENVQALSYVPLGRGLFTYFSNTALERPEVQAFAKFLVEETELINTTAGFVGLTPAQQTEQLARIDALVG